MKQLSSTWSRAGRGRRHPWLPPAWPWPCPRGWRAPPWGRPSPRRWRAWRRCSGQHSVRRHGTLANYWQPGLNRDARHLYGFSVSGLPGCRLSLMSVLLILIYLVLILSKIHELSATVLPSLIFTMNIFEVSARCINTCTHMHFCLFFLDVCCFSCTLWRI